MKRDLWTTVVVALTAILLTWLVLGYVERNPWMLVGLAAILLAVAAIVRAIRGPQSPSGDLPGATEDVATPPETGSRTNVRQVARRRARRSGKRRTASRRR